MGSFPYRDLIHPNVGLLANSLSIYLLKRYKNIRCSCKILFCTTHLPKIPNGIITQHSSLQFILEYHFNNVGCHSFYLIFIFDIFFFYEKPYSYENSYTVLLANKHYCVPYSPIIWLCIVFFFSLYLESDV